MFPMTSSSFHFGEIIQIKCRTWVRSEDDSLFSSSFLADFAPDELEVGVREHILQDLETFVRRQYAGEGNHRLHCSASFILYNLN